MKVNEPMSKKTLSGVKKNLQDSQAPQKIRFSIRSKLLLSITIPAFLTVLFVYSYYPGKHYQYALKTLMEKVQVMADMTSSGVGHALRTGDFATVSRTIRIASADSGVVFVALYDESGALLASHDPSDILTAGSSLKDVESTKSASYVTAFSNAKGLDDTQLSVAVAYSLAQVINSSNKFRQSALTLSLLGLLLSVAIAFYLSSRISRPVRSLVHTMQDVAASGKFDTRVEKISSDELGALADHFNEMISEIGAREQEKKSAENKRLELESRLQQAQKLEAVGTLAGGIAHDFNNLLGVILGYNELAKLAAPKGSEQEAQLSHIHTAGSRARDLVRQILDFSRHGNKKLVPVPVADVMIAVTTDLKATLNKNIKVQHNWDGEIGCVMADETEVHRIVLNICNNAAQAMEEDGGTISIDLDIVELSSSFANERLVLSDRDYIRITISDTGCGIDPENLKRIFEPFFTTKDVGQGTGLGLATVHSSVKSMGGAISVHSVKGEGTTFHVYLPQTDVCYEPEVALEKMTRGTGQRVMVIDDEELLVTMCSAMLKQLGYEVTSFSVSTEALETFAKNPDNFDLIVTDQRMPTLTGSELTAEIHKIRPEIPVILVTGFSETVSSKNASSCGFSDYLPKPYTKKHLGDSISMIFEP